MNEVKEIKKEDNKWVRSLQLEEAYGDMHKIRPEIHKDANSSMHLSKVKFKKKKLEIEMTEVLEHGLTKLCTIEYDGKVESFDRVYDAELRINQLLGK